MRFRFSLRTFLIVVPLVTSALVLSCMWWGRGGRGEFSPDTFQRRSQTEYTLPILAVPIWRTPYKYQEDYYPLVDYLVEQRYWEPRETENPRWLVLFHWNMAWRDGHSYLQHDVLRPGARWIEWSEANPEMAAVVWPRYLELLRSGANAEDCYYLLLYARQSSSVTELKQRVNGDIDLPSLGVTLP